MHVYDPDDSIDPPPLDWLGLVILLYKLLSRAGAGGSEKGSRRAVPVR